MANFATGMRKKHVDDSMLVSAWFEQLKSRPAYKKAFYRGSRLSEIYDGASYGSDDNPASEILRTEGEG